MDELSAGQPPTKPALRVSPVAFDSSNKYDRRTRLGPIQSRGGGPSLQGLTPRIDLHTLASFCLESQKSA